MPLVAWRPRGFLVHELREHSASVDCLVISQDHRFFATGSRSLTPQPSPVIATGTSCLAGLCVGCSGPGGRAVILGSHLA